MNSADIARPRSTRAFDHWVKRVLGKRKGRRKLPPSKLTVPRRMRNDCSMPLKLNVRGKTLQDDMGVVQYILP